MYVCFCLCMKQYASLLPSVFAFCRLLSYTCLIIYTCYLWVLQFRKKSEVWRLFHESRMVLFCLLTVLLPPRDFQCTELVCSWQTLITDQFVAPLLVQFITSFSPVCFILPSLSVNFRYLIDILQYALYQLLQIYVYPQKRNIVFQFLVFIFQTNTYIAFFTSQILF